MRFQHPGQRVSSNALQSVMLPILRAGRILDIVNASFSVYIGANRGIWASIERSMLEMQTGMVLIHCGIV
jgi:hypothetical protein